MNQNNDPTCSRDLKSFNDQKQTLELDKNERSITDDQTVDTQTGNIKSSHQTTLPKSCKDVPSLILVLDKQRDEHQTSNEIDNDKIQEYEEEPSSYTDGSHRHIIGPEADDTGNSNINLLSTAEVLDKRIVEYHNTKSRSKHQEPLVEYGKDLPTIKYLKSYNDITELTKLDNNRKAHQTTLEECIRHVLSVIEVIDKQVEPDIDKEYNKEVPPSIDLSDKEIVASSIKDDTRPFQNCNKVVLSVIKIIDKQTADSQTDDKIGSNKVEAFNENISSVLDELESKIFEPRVNDKINSHQNTVVLENRVDSLTPKAFKLSPTLSNLKIVKAHQSLQLRDDPSTFLQSTATQLRILSNLPSPISININSSQPQTLFLQALSKLNESSISFAVNSLDKRPDSSISRAIVVCNRPKSPELTPPDSLGSAPPSYSFVLRQMAVRRRPRMFGAFVPSPSFIQRTPPPTYTASFDIYLDNIPSPPTRVYNFGFAPMLVVCPDCGFTGMTHITSKITLCTHLCAFTLCIMCCWVCVPLPYVMRSCKDVYHYCRNCRSFLGTYCPTNPDNVTIR